MTLYSFEIGRELAKIEDDLEKHWNHKGEPWCIVNPTDGRVIAKGLGGIILWIPFSQENQEKEVTEWFDDLSADELDDIFLKTVPNRPLPNYLEFERRYCGNGKMEDILQKWRQADLNTGGVFKLATLIKGGHDLKGKILTHYHPNGGPPTDRDLEVFQVNKLLEVRAFGKGLLYILRRQ